MLGMGIGLGVGVGVGVGEDSMDAGGPPSVGSMEAQPVLSNTQTPVSTKKVGRASSPFSFHPLYVFNAPIHYVHYVFLFFIYFFVYFLFLFIFFFH